MATIYDYTLTDGKGNQVPLANFKGKVLAHPFVDGNGRCDRIWLNLLLKVRLGYMIDWESIDRNVYYGLLQNASEDEEPILDYLKSYLLK